MPFEKLMEHAAALGAEDASVTMGQLSDRWGEPAERIMDAIDAVRVMRGERTYVTVRPVQDKPVCPKCGTPGCLENKGLDWGRLNLRSRAT